ncbi:MAG: tetratricopeptide repeat protein, partial [Anaerolineae bacterium]
VMGARALEVMDPDHVDYPHELLAAHRLLGWAYYNIPGREDQAIEHYRQALDLEEDAPTYLYLGRLYFAKEEFGQALAMFQSAVFAEPCYEHVGDVYYAIGTCLAVLEQYEDALIYLQKAREEQATITFRPFYIYKSLGWSYWHLDRYDEAALAFKTALGLMHPNDRQYREIEHYLREVQAQGVAPFSHGDSG